MHLIPPSASSGIIGRWLRYLCRAWLPRRCPRPPLLFVDSACQSRSAPAPKRPRPDQPTPPRPVSCTLTFLQPTVPSSPSTDTFAPDPLSLVSSDLRHLSRQSPSSIALASLRNGPTRHLTRVADSAYHRTFHPSYHPTYTALRRTWSCPLASLPFNCTHHLLSSRCTPP